MKAELEKDNTTENIFSKIEVAGVGFLNFYLSGESFGHEIEKINSEGEHYGDLDLGKKRKIHLDFVSANPTGPIHLGNGRGGPLGDALANVLQKANFSVWREFYVNDFGNQIKVLGHSILKDSEAQYKGEYIDSLAEKNIETDPFLVGREATRVILKEMITPAMENLGIKFDQYFQESLLHESGEVEKVFALLEEKDLSYEKDSALWFRASQFGDEKDRVIRKATGEVTYFGGDIAYHLNKLAIRKFDLAIDIWGADHHGDVNRVQGAIKALGYGGKLKIIITQNLTVIKNGEEFKMSKRRGQYICLEDLIDEVGRDAVRFIFLAYSANSPMIFDIDLARAQTNENPVYYIQYAHARICSVLNQWAGDIKSLHQADLSPLSSDHDAALMQRLSEFPEVVRNAAHDLAPHAVANYLKDLASDLHSFYSEHKILVEDEKVKLARLALISVTQQVLQNGLQLLGVSAPDKM